LHRHFAIQNHVALLLPALCCSQRSAAPSALLLPALCCSQRSAAPRRCLAALNLKGLQEVIGVSVTHPTWQRTRPENPKDEHCGWAFRAPGDPPLSSSTGGMGSPGGPCSALFVPSCGEGQGGGCSVVQPFAMQCSYLLSLLTHSLPSPAFLQHQASLSISRPLVPSPKQLFSHAGSQPHSCAAGCIRSHAIPTSPCCAAVLLYCCCPAGFGSFGCEGCIPDGVNGAKFVRDLYELANDTGGAAVVWLRHGALTGPDKII
jgi:hypothetical protein